MSELRIIYAAGPGDVVGTFRKWLQAEHDYSVPDVTYSEQFLDVCKRIGARGWLISANSRRDDVQEGAFRAENRPIPLDRCSGILFHLGRVLYTLGLVFSAIRFRAHVIIIAHGVHWFVLSVLPIFGIRVIPSIHNTLWLPLIPPKFSERVQLRLARPIFASRSLAILTHPGTCADQIVELTRGQNRPIVTFISYYRERDFVGISQIPTPRPPFRVMFAGRVEANKGVFDLVEIARQLAARNRLDIEFDICGTGSALDALRQAVVSAGIETHFRCHGRMQGDIFRQMFGKSHVVVVPTRGGFGEGFNAVVAEAILSGRPVITSKLCPAIDLVRDAAIEVPPEDVDAYRDAILQMADDDSLYTEKRAACDGLQGQFFDRNSSWGGALERILAELPRF